MGSVRPFLEGSLKQPWLKALAAFSLKQPAGKEEADFRPDTFRSTLLPRNRAILDLSLSLSLARLLARSLALARSLCKTEDHPTEGPGSTASLWITSSLLPYPSYPPCRARIERGGEGGEGGGGGGGGSTQVHHPFADPSSGLRNTFFFSQDGYITSGTIRDNFWRNEGERERGREGVWYRKEETGRCCSVLPYFP